MYILKKIQIELPKNHLDIVELEKPDDVDIIIVEDEFLNASGEIFEVAIIFILQQIAAGILNKIGEDIYEYLKKLILRNNDSIDAGAISLKIKTTEFNAKFDLKNLNSNNIDIALQAFTVILDKLNETNLLNIHNDDLVFEEKTKQWTIRSINNQKSIDDLRNEVMENYKH
jgi:hypothetical protein